MSLTDVTVTATRSNNFLDLTPMISALQFQPTDFEFSRGWLTHVCALRWIATTRYD